MNLDVTTLLIVNVVNLALTAGTLPFIMGRQLSRGAWFARSALIMQALGWLLMISSEQFSGHWLDRALSVTSVSCMGLGEWWMFRALGAWLGPRRWGRLLAVVCVLTPIGYFLSFDSYPLRVGWTNFMLALQLVLVAQACLLRRHAPAPVADAFIATRLGDAGLGGRIAGAIDTRGIDVAAILQRAFPG